VHANYHFSIDPPDPADRRSAPRSGRDVSTHVERVLIVEDEIFIQLDLERELLAAGFTVVGVADTAEDAVRVAGRERPDVVLMDIRLRGDRDGVDAALEIWERYGIRCLFISGTIDRALMARAAPTGPLGFVRKPFVGKEIIALLKPTN